MACRPNLLESPMDLAEALDGVPPPPCDDFCVHKSRCRTEVLACPEYWGYVNQSGRPQGGFPGGGHLRDMSAHERRRPTREIFHLCYPKYDEPETEQ